MSSARQTQNNVFTVSLSEAGSQKRPCTLGCCKPDCPIVQCLNAIERDTDCATSGLARHRHLVAIRPVQMCILCARRALASHHNKDTCRYCAYFIVSLICWNGTVASSHRNLITDRCCDGKATKSVLSDSHHHKTWKREDPLAYQRKSSVLTTLDQDSVLAMMDQDSAFLDYTPRERVYVAMSAQIASLDALGI